MLFQTMHFRFPLMLYGYYMFVSNGQIKSRLPMLMGFPRKPHFKKREQ